MELLEGPKVSQDYRQRVIRVFGAKVWDLRFSLNFVWCVVWC